MARFRVASAFRSEPAEAWGPPAVTDGAGSLTVAEVGERESWNRIVLSLGDADLRQGYEWGEVRRILEGRPYRYAVFRNAAPVAAVSITAWRPLGFPYALLYASRGPVLGSADAAAWRGLLHAIRDVAARTSAIFLRVSPGVVRQEAGLHGRLLAHGFTSLPDEWSQWNAPRVIMTLDIRPGEAELKRGMRQSTRLCLTRAFERGVQLDTDVSPAAVGRFHRLLSVSGSRHGQPVRDLAFFQALRRQYLASGQGCLLRAHHGGRDLAGVLAVRFGRRAYLLYSCVDRDSAEARRLRTGTALHWALIRWAKAAGCDSLDWGGAVVGVPPQPDDPGFGVYDFKRGFGCSLTCLTGYYDLVFKPLLYRSFRHLETRYAPWIWKVRARFNRSA